MANQSARPWKDIDLPEEMLRIPGLLSVEERRYLVWLTTEHNTDSTAVVELGCWLGASSAALAEGLRRGNSSEKVHSRDLFRWHAAWNGLAPGVELSDGEDFLPVFRELTAPYREHIDAQRLDLTESTWDGGPIGILFVDPGKSWKLLDSVLACFGPSLVPGESRIVLQDFRHHSACAFPVAFDKRPDLWQEAESVDHGTTVSFVLKKPWEHDRDALEERWFSFSAAEPIFRQRIEASPVGDRVQYQAGLLAWALAEERDAEADALEDQMLELGLTEALDLAPEVVRLALGQVLATAKEEGSGASESRADELHTRLERVNRQTRRVRSRCEKAQALLGQAEFDATSHRLESAQSRILSALELIEPPNALTRDALSLLEQTFHAQQDLDQARHALARLQPRFGDQPDFLALSAIVLRHAGEHAQARNALQRAVERHPDHQDAQRLLSAWFEGASPSRGAESTREDETQES